MTRSDYKSPSAEWHDYYKQFPNLSSDAIRDGCHPQIMLQAEPASKAIVLTHGLRDSPYFMAAIGRYFHTQLGYDVYLPLLQGHGLKEPAGMEKVSQAVWKENVNFAIECASQRSETVSVGGLSTGGLLSFLMGATDKKINGAVYLFAAALDLKGGGPFDVVGELKEWAMRLSFIDEIADFNKPLISDDPYRYSHVDMDGAHELGKLIEEGEDYLETLGPNNLYPKPVFAAHWEGDERADIAGIEALRCVADPARFEFFRMGKDEKVTHPSLVLDGPIEKNGVVYEEKNPRFDEMMAAVAAFEKKSGC